MAVAIWISVTRKFPKGAVSSLSQIGKSFGRAFLSLSLLIVVVGGIVKGIFTATEGAAVAVLYALVLALSYKQLKISQIPSVLLNSVKTTAMVMFLVATSMAMSWLFSFQEIPRAITDFFLGMTTNKILILLMINLILLVVGTFMDMTPAVLIFTPIFLPVVMTLGMDPVHFGIVMVLNLCIGLCTPPVGTLLFVGSAVAKIPVTQVIRPLLPFMIAMVIALVLITYIPTLSLWLPGMFDLLK
jgi:tripartite ATP-independent transporter DctM subunit